MHVRIILPWHSIVQTRFFQDKAAKFAQLLASSRLRDSRALWIEKAGTRKLNGRKLGREGVLSPFLSIFSRPVKFSRAFYFRVFPTIWEPGTGYAATFYSSPKQNKRLIQVKIKLFIVDKRLILLTFIFTCANDSLFFAFFMVLPGGEGEEHGLISRTAAGNRAKRISSSIFWPKV